MEIYKILGIKDGGSQKIITNVGEYKIDNKIMSKNVGKIYDENGDEVFIKNELIEALQKLPTTYNSELCIKLLNK